MSQSTGTCLKNPLKADSSAFPQRVCQPWRAETQSEGVVLSVTWPTSHTSYEINKKTPKPHMSLSILAHTNPICTAMRDFVLTDYLALDKTRCTCTEDKPLHGTIYVFRRIYNPTHRGGRKAAFKA